MHMRWTGRKNHEGSWPLIGSLSVYVVCACVSRRNVQIWLGFHIRAGFNCQRCIKKITNLVQMHRTQSTSPHDSLNGLVLMFCDRRGSLRTWQMCPFHLSITVSVWSADVPPSSVTIWPKFVEVCEIKASPKTKAGDTRAQQLLRFQSLPKHLRWNPFCFKLRTPPAWWGLTGWGERERETDGDGERPRERTREKSVWIVRSFLI